MASVVGEKHVVRINRSGEVLGNKCPTATYWTGGFRLKQDYLIECRWLCYAI